MGQTVILFDADSENGGDGTRKLNVLCPKRKSNKSFLNGKQISYIRNLFISYLENCIGRWITFPKSFALLLSALASK